MRWTGGLIALGCLLALAMGTTEEGVPPGDRESAVVQPSAPVIVGQVHAATLATWPRPTVAAEPQAAPETAPPVPEKVLRGRVTDPDGQGVAFLTVEIQFTSRRRRAPAWSTTETKRDGTFETPVPERANVALVWARSTDRWISHPGVTAVRGGLLMWQPSRGEEVMRDVQGRLWNPDYRTQGIWQQVPLRVRPARRLSGRVVPRETGSRSQDLRVLVQARWPDPVFVQCTATIRADVDGVFSLLVPGDASLLDVGIPARTREEWDDERTELVEVLVEEGNDDEAIAAAYASVRKPYPGFWLSTLQGHDDGVVLHLPESHEVAYRVRVDGRAARPREVSLSMSLERGNGLDVHPHCTLSGASCLAAGRYRLSVHSVEKLDGVPLFSGSVQVDVPGPAVVVECRRP
ncbi:MAG: hypothetical protein GY946_22845 [bacterium]|nr:hypothetical protein [bacterium]